MNKNKAEQILSASNHAKLLELYVKKGKSSYYRRIAYPKLKDFTDEQQQWIKTFGSWFKVKNVDSINYVMPDIPIDMQYYLQELALCDSLQSHYVKRNKWPVFNNGDDDYDDDNEPDMENHFLLNNKKPKYFTSATIEIVKPSFYTPLLQLKLFKYGKYHQLSLTTIGDFYAFYNASEEEAEFADYLKEQKVDKQDKETEYFINQIRQRKLSNSEQADVLDFINRNYLVKSKPKKNKQ